MIAESEDESLLDRYLGGEELDPDTLAVDLEKAVAGGHFHPVVPVCSTTGTGVPELLDLLVRAFPSPLEHPLLPVTRPDGAPAGTFTCDPDGPLVAQVVRTGTDPYLGRVCLVRVFSGTLRPDLPVHLSGHASTRPEHDDDARVGPLSSPLGAVSRTVSACPAGDLCTVARLSGAQTGDTLSAVDRPLLVPAWELPAPQLPVAVEAASPADEDKLDEALARIAVEDPSVRVHRDAETGQLVLWCLGDAHAEVLLERLGVPVERPEVRVALRETLAAPAAVTGRLVKQSGGHGQYAVVALELTPLPTGSGITFQSRVVGGSVPTAYVGSVEKGVRQQAGRGVHDGRPLGDVAVTLVDGKAHSVDSSDAAFTSAGALGVREAVAAVGTTVLEPVSALEITVPTWSVGAVLSDLAGRRTRVTGSEAATGPDGLPDSELTVVRAETPDVELLRYAVRLRALTHGTGTFHREPLRHEPAPAAPRALAGSR